MAIVKGVPNVIVAGTWADEYFQSSVIGNNNIAYLYEWRLPGGEAKHLQLNVVSDTGTSLLGLDHSGYYPNLTPLSGGRFLITWTKSDFYQYNPDGPNFYRAMVDHFVYDSNLNNVIQVVTAATVYTNGYSFHSSDAVALKGGGWVETDSYIKHDTINGQYVIILDEHLRFYGKDGSLLSSMNDISSNSESFGLALSDGTFVRLSDESDEISYSKYTANGVTLVSNLLVNDDTDGDQEFGDAEALGNGGWVVGWTSYEEGSRIASIYQTVYAKDGSSIKDVRINDNSAFAGFEITVLSDGGWVATWISYGTVQNQVRQQVFNANGTARSGIVRVDVDAPTAGSQNYYPQLEKVVALSDGGFVVGWKDYYGATGRISVYDSAGKAIENPITIQGDISDVLSLDDGSWSVIYKNDRDVFQQDFDKAKPATPVLTLTSDTGSSATDKITSNGALTVAGKESGTTLRYVVDGGTASSTYSPSKLSDGNHTVKVTQVDKSGNVSSSGSITFTLDTKAPTVAGVSTSGSGISSGAGTLVTGQTAKVTVSMSEAVTITNAAKLTLTLSNGKLATYDSSASTAKKLVFSYGVELEDISSDLSVKKLNLNGATIKDAAGHSANLTSVVVNPAGKLVIDGYTGTSGKDSFKGTTGAETFRGLTGDDSYVVNNAKDKIIEKEDAGTDLVKASVSHTLAANVENLTLTGGGKINGTGNSLSNTILGNSGINTLSGGGGDDKLYGGLGKDSLIGGSGTDIFVFDTKLGTANIDKISDFSVKDDTIFLDGDIFTKAGKVGDLLSSAFYIGTKAHDSSDRVIYDSKSGKLWYDADGTGSTKAVQFALLDTGLKMTASDFDIIA